MTSPQPTSGARALALLLIGLFVGAMVSVVAMQSLQQKSGYVDGLMAVLQRHHQQLRLQVRRGQCELPQVRQHLDRLQQLTPDIAAALANRGSLVQSMTDDLATAIGAGSEGLSCDSLPKLVSAVDTACKACHSQLR